MKTTINIIFFLLPVFAFAQFQHVNSGNLTVFSEDGDKFYLVLNGEKQNEEPQTNIRIEELTQPYYSAKIMFEDKSLADISKKNLTITDADGVFMDVTYKIKKDKNKKVKLNYFSMTAVQPDFVPPSNMYVHQFGQPRNNPNGYGGQPNGTTTTTTTTTTNNNSTFGASMNMPGMNVNISISDPDAGMSTHQTTTSSHTQSIEHNPPPRPNYSSNSNGCNGWPMNSNDFSAAKKTISESSFDDTKLATAKSIVSNNCLSTDQVVVLCNLFSFEENKLAFAKFAYKYTTDPKNYFKVNNVFNFSSSKEELSEFTQQSQ